MQAAHLMKTCADDHKPVFNGFAHREYYQGRVPPNDNHGLPQCRQNTWCASLNSPTSP
ncbi:hypothetical protein M404DRAFT_992065 [Pisolithus tinctorius Marx 270]|uniref:Uncharacterized protein n=1 Tax=Pisolithus tinctorius Marx 270 TaxID=870435 RepID=A0A0C3KWH2_PISTI|nr:hypothetical protein M404DRAFT_992065 [Pisolithus tinctorius Marx 270]